MLNLPKLVQVRHDPKWFDAIGCVIHRPPAKSDSMVERFGRSTLGMCDRLEQCSPAVTTVVRSGMTNEIHLQWSKDRFIFRLWWMQTICTATTTYDNKSFERTHRHPAVFGKAGTMDHSRCLSAIVDRIGQCTANTQTIKLFTLLSQKQKKNNVA